MSRDRDQSGDFGGHLRQARERKGISLRAIADVTRISVAALEALERNDLTKLPGGIFTRAFVRAYAHEVGLDPKVAVDDFVRQFQDDSVTVGHPAAARFDDTVAVERMRRAVSLGLTLVVVGLLIGVVAYGVVGWRGRRDARVQSTSAVAATVASRPTRLLVRMVARTPCLLSYSIDGQPNVTVSLPTGSRRTLEALSTLVVTVDDAAAVDVQINGREAKAFGPRGTSVTVQISRDNVGALLVAP